MFRHAAAVGIVLCFAPSLLFGQSVQFTVTVDSAKIHKSPSTGAPVVSEVPRGTVFEATRELGSWIRIVWPAAPDGVGYVHRSWGTVTRGASNDQARAAEAGPARPPEPPSLALEYERVGRAAGPVVSPPVRLHYVVPPSHVLAFGGRLSGSTLGIGATARGWSRDRFGVQVDVLRYELTSAAAPGRVTSIQFAPSILYSLGNHVGDFVWARPYVGAGVAFTRQTFSETPSTGDSISESSGSFQAFGGAEFTFAAVPRFAVGTDLAYRRSRTAVSGFELRGLGFSVSAHWYVK